MSNPLLEFHTLPPFRRIEPTHVVPAIEKLIADNLEELETLLSNPDQPNWENLVAPLEAADDRLNRNWSPVSHINAVVNSEALRKAYNHCVVVLTDYHTKLGQHQGLYDAYRQLAAGEDYPHLNNAQRKTIDNALRDFKLAGVALPASKKQRFSTIKSRLSALSSQFADNVLDATQAWYKQVVEVDQLAGLPETALAAARQAAAGKSLPGYVITLEMPAYIAVMTHADNRELRREVYTAYVTRASDLGVTADGESTPQWDNAPLIAETLSLRHELAQLLGFGNYAEYSLAKKMAQSPAQVVGFLEKLAEKSHAYAVAEHQELEAFALARDGIEQLEAWDVTYYGEKLRQEKYAVSQEELRPYFPAEKVIEGMFTVVQRLFAIDIEKQTEVDVWHPDVRFYRVARAGETLAYFYLDLFARENKRGGAWMDECRVRRQTVAGLQLPVAYLTCNFTPPLEDVPSLLTHNEVTTLFHEFGHGLHHMLTQVDCAPVSGINGVAWDAVELPSQFLENWCWEKSVVPLISGHHQTGEHLPQHLLEKMLAAKNFQAGMIMVRQLEFALFDFRLHLDYDPGAPGEPQTILDEVRRQVAVVKAPPFNRFQNSFSHVFAGGYAAGYYSYKWAEVLSSDAFSLFEQQGVFDRATGERFLHEILACGGAEDAMQLFINFRGREPQLDALLRHSGMT
ncbi:oligopeptidase A [Exilibacterium tricleocarpae]|uniref:oligopeptidase A n=1 Tax=Exilibacterium tricleocarpae TaxID=2591008 RepID=A0A545T0G1_9GAMM|nr:oligopeptidase A [Exilibacterium tricleocarpae]TQV70705.1 oligopeptidase A [Exilibacterium tricleocarpae]